MIKSLQIKNYAIIEALEIDFSKGLTIITGETGAGKSILLGALGLIMGKRADTKSLYVQDQKCVVEGLFDIKDYDLTAFFEQEDIDYDDELFIRREITPSGKSRAFINDTPVNLNILQQLSSSLIDLHLQFDSLDIHQVSFQLRLLDALAGNKALLRKYQQLYRQYRADLKILKELKERNERSARELDFLTFQLEEFREVGLIEGELVKLEEENAGLTNAEEIRKTLSEAYRFLSEEEHSVIGQLEAIGLSLANIRKFTPQLQQLDERFSGIVLELQDLAAEFEKVAGHTEFDEERIAVIQGRLDLIYRLQNKHGAGSLEDLLRIQEELEKQLTSLTDLSVEIAGLEKDVNKQEAQLLELALNLRSRRRGVVKGFEQEVQKMLGQLAMEHARLSVEFAELPDLGATGLDEVNFLFAANRGSRLQLIKDVASGGELSRLTLVAKSLVASAIPLPTLIFDEIDTGISGDVSLRIGNILRKLSDQHQVVSITHSPQVASKADAHYLVYKKEKKDRTVTRVRMLNQEERIRAIATMLSQSPPSDSAIENAKELLSYS